MHVYKAQEKTNLKQKENEINNDGFKSLREPIISACDF